MSSTFGTLLKVSTFGESHCKGVGAVLDGCPPGMALCEADIQPQLDRRRPGQSKLTTDRQEADRVTIFSGVENGITLGTPIGLFVPNKDQRPGDYRQMSRIPRPSHADFTYQMKYGVRASSGGGRSSARETIGRVAAGAVAEKMLKEAYGVEIVAWVSAVSDIASAAVDVQTITRQTVDGNLIRCPDAAVAGKMEALVARVKEEKDSVGGIVTCVCRYVPPGWGEPVFDKMEAKLAQAMLSIPATKGFEIGSGFAGTRLKGSVHNDPFMAAGGRLGTTPITAGAFRAASPTVNPLFCAWRSSRRPPSASHRQTVDFDGNPVSLEAKGRHDPCVVPRAVPIVEAMAALVLGDFALRQKMRV
jgi:chorismate synthase